MAIEKIREGLYIKKDRFGYRVVYPIENDDGTTNWFNLLTGGTWYKLIFTIIVVLLVLGMSYSYYHDVKACLDLQDNICDYLPNISASCVQPTDYNFNFSFEEIEVRGNETGG